jgi:hypothetical protein
VIVLLMVAAAVGAVAAFARGNTPPSAAHCGGTTWRLQTFSDAQRRQVSVSPLATTIGDIRLRHGPGAPPRRRITAYQFHTWEVPAQITSFKLDASGSVRLVLYDDNAYVNAVIPSPSCLSARTRDRADITAAWHLFVDKCGKATASWQSLGAIFFVRGIGFWGPRSGAAARGSAPNGAELHPVTGLRVVAGC